MRLGCHLWERSPFPLHLYCVRAFSSIFPFHLLPPTILPLLSICTLLIEARILILKERDKIHWLPCRRNPPTSKTGSLTTCCDTQVFFYTFHILLRRSKDNLKDLSSIIWGRNWAWTLGVSPSSGGVSELWGSRLAVRMEDAGGGGCPRSTVSPATGDRGICCHLHSRCWVPGPFFLKGILIRDKLPGIRRRQATRKALMESSPDRGRAIWENGWKKGRNPNSGASAPTQGVWGTQALGGGELSPVSPEIEVWAQERSNPRTEIRLLA